jgi:hypothetical protein
MVDSVRVVGIVAGVLMAWLLPVLVGSAKGHRVNSAIGALAPPSLLFLAAALSFGPDLDLPILLAIGAAGAYLVGVVGALLPAKPGSEWAVKPTVRKSLARGVGVVLAVALGVAAFVGVILIIDRLTTTRPEPLPLASPTLTSCTIQETPVGQRVRVEGEYGHYDHDPVIKISVSDEGDPNDSWDGCQLFVELWSSVEAEGLPPRGARIVVEGLLVEREWRVLEDAIHVATAPTS